MKLGILTVVLLVASANLSGYVLSGTKWHVQTVPYYINPENADGIPHIKVIDAIRRAAEAWRLQAGQGSPEWVYMGLTDVNTIIRNGKNEVFFAGDENAWGARSYSWWKSTGERIETTLIFNDVKRKFFAPDAPCSNGHYVDHIATHEFGHMLGLSHSPVGNATMYATTTFCSRSWVTLAEDDIDGIQAIYPEGI
jgi:hypothetical protein